MNFYFLIYRGTKEKHHTDCRHNRLPCKTVDDLYKFFDLDKIFDYDNFLKAIEENNTIFVHINPILEHEYKTNVLYWSLKPEKNALQYHLFLHGIAKV